MLNIIAMKNIILSIFLVLIVRSIAISQNTENEKLDWWSDIDGFINQQDKITLMIVEEALEKTFYKSFQIV